MATPLKTHEDRMAALESLYLSAGANQTEIRIRIVEVASAIDAEQRQLPESTDFTIKDAE